MKSTRQLINFLVALIILSTIINGSSFWLKRVGWIDTIELNQLISERTASLNSLKQLRQSQGTLNDSQIHQVRDELILSKQRLLSFLYSSGERYYLKLFKFIVLAALVLICLSQNLSQLLSNFLRAKLFCLILMIALLSTIFNESSQNLFSIISGLYSLSFLILAVIADPYFDEKFMRALAKGLYISLAILLIMSAVELQLGIQIFQNRSILEKRLCGFFNQPSSMGIFAVICGTFVLSQWKDVITLWRSLIILIITGLFAFASGSMTALILFSITVYTLLVNKHYSLRKMKEYWILILFLFLLIILMVVLTGRDGIDSFTGRIEKLAYYLSLKPTIFQLLFGNGLGAGTNLHHQVASVFSDQGASTPIYNFSVDSMALLMFMQIGLVGCGLCYASLLLCLKDCQEKYRIVILLITLSSFTINIAELFPVNLMLGLILAQPRPLKSADDSRSMI